MAQSALMPGANGTEVKCFRRAVRNTVAGDWLPEYGAHVLAPPITDPETEGLILALDNGTDLEFSQRAKVWLHRTYTAPDWMQAAVADWRAAYDAREAMRESPLPAPTSVPGLAGSQVACFQLEAADFNAAFPAPRLSEFIREYAAQRREGMIAA